MLIRELFFEILAQRTLNSFITYLIVQDSLFFRGYIQTDEKHIL